MVSIDDMPAYSLFFFSFCSCLVICKGMSKIDLKRLEVKVKFVYIAPKATRTTALGACDFNPSNSNLDSNNFTFPYHRKIFHIKILSHPNPWLIKKYFLSFSHLYPVS